MSELTNYNKVLAIVMYKNYHKYPYTPGDHDKKIKDIRGGKYKSFRSSVAISFY